LTYENLNTDLGNLNFVSYDKLTTKLWRTQDNLRNFPKTFPCKSGPRVRISVSGSESPWRRSVYPLRVVSFEFTAQWRYWRYCYISGSCQLVRAM